MSTATSRARVSPITAAHGSRLLPIEVCVRRAGVLRLKRSASASPLEVATGTVRVATKVKTSASRPCRRRAPAHTATSAVAMAANGSSTTTACTTSTCTGSPEMVFSPTVGEPPDDCRPNGIRTPQLSHQLSHRRRRRRVVSYPAHRVRHAAGVALTNDFVSGNFPRAYGLWQSVDAGPPLPYVPISRAQRLAVYRVSVAAAELESSMEGPEQAWIGPGCGGLGVCDDIAGGWIPWAVRDAASRAGYFRSAAAAQAFFGRLGDEIAAACASGRLRCHTPMPSMLPTPASVSGRRLLESAWRAARYTVGFQLANGRRAVSKATPEQWTQFRRVT